MIDEAWTEASVTVEGRSAETGGVAELRADQSADGPPAEDQLEWQVSTDAGTPLTAAEVPETTESDVDDSVERPVEDRQPDGNAAQVADAAADVPPDAQPALSGSANIEPDAVVSAAALVEALVATAAPKRHKRRQAQEASVTPQVPGPPDPAAVADHPSADPAHDAAAQTIGDVAEPAPGDACDEPPWQEQWPLNEVRIVGRLLARASDAPALDGVERTRMELSLVEQHDGVFGTMGNLPIFVMPGAPGFMPIYNEIRRARKQDRRITPIMVEVQGILRQLPDRDGRYATERYRVLMGVEVHKITRVAADTEQFAYWRGRATVTASRRYEYRGLAYQRVTAVVELRQRKPRLRGTSITHIPVDFLVAPEHEHADRFQHIGQRLLIEAHIAPETQRMNDNHPDLAGIDDPRRRAQLQVLRESIVSMTMGEFPDEAAERDYQAWLKAGRPRPERRARVPRPLASTPPDARGPGDPEVANAGGRQHASSSGARDRKRSSSAR